MSPKQVFSELRGQRVILAPFSAVDITPEYVSWLNDPLVVKYSNQRFLRHTPSTCAAYLSGFERTGNLFIKVRQSEDGLFVGTMTAYISTPHETANIGIMVGHRPAWGKGIGQDAWTTLLNWLLRQEAIRKVDAGAMRCNAAMVKVMERSGMTLEAVRPAQEVLDGVPQDIVYYGKFR